MELHRGRGDTLALMRLVETTIPLVDSPEDKGRLRYEEATLRLARDETPGAATSARTHRRRVPCHGGGRGFARELARSARKARRARLPGRREARRRQVERRRKRPRRCRSSWALCSSERETARAVGAYRGVLEWNPSSREALRAVVRLGESAGRASVEHADAIERLMVLEEPSLTLPLAMRLIAAKRAVRPERRRTCAGVRVRRGPYERRCARAAHCSLSRARRLGSRRSGLTASIRRRSLRFPRSYSAQLRRTSTREKSNTPFLRSTWRSREPRAIRIFSRARAFERGAPSTRRCSRGRRGRARGPPEGAKARSWRRPWPPRSSAPTGKLQRGTRSVSSTCSKAWERRRPRGNTSRRFSIRSRPIRKRCPGSRRLLRRRRDGTSRSDLLATRGRRRRSTARRRGDESRRTRARRAPRRCTVGPRAGRVTSARERRTARTPSSSVRDQRRDARARGAAFARRTRRSRPEDAQRYVASRRRALPRAARGRDFGNCSSPRSTRR